MCYKQGFIIQAHYPKEFLATVFTMVAVICEDLHPQQLNGFKVILTLLLSELTAIFT
jgi:hypothetical protein